MFRTFVVDCGVREWETNVVVFVETVSLQSINDNRCLKWWFKVCKTQDCFFQFISFFISWNQSNCFEAFEWSEYMSNFSFRCVYRHTFHVHRVSCIFWNMKNFIHYLLDILRILNSWLIIENRSNFSDKFWKRLIKTEIIIKILALRLTIFLNLIQNRLIIDFFKSLILI